MTRRSGSYLGSAGPGVVEIDSTAAGLGWFFDAAPNGDAEFAPGKDGRLIAAQDGAAAGHLDLLTAVMHELGHVLGKDDTYRPADRASVMYGYLEPGERRMPHN